MLRSDLNPLAPRSKLSPIDPNLAIAGAAALSVGAAAAGNLVSKWVWRRYVEPKRKRKQAVRHGSGEGAVYIIEAESIEERITRKVRVVLKKRF
jgi:hypothetical protein